MLIAPYEVHIKYEKPKHFFGMICESDTVGFLSLQDASDYIRGKRTYDYLDESVCLRTDEIPIYVICNPGAEKLTIEQVLAL